MFVRNCKQDGEQYKFVFGEGVMCRCFIYVSGQLAGLRPSEFIRKHLVSHSIVD